MKFYDPLSCLAILRCSREEARHVSTELAIPFFLQHAPTVPFISRLSFLTGVVCGHADYRSPYQACRAARAVVLWGAGAVQGGGEGRCGDGPTEGGGLCQGKRGGVEAAGRP